MNMLAIRWEKTEVSPARRNHIVGLGDFSTAAPQLLGIANSLPENRILWRKNPHRLGKGNKFNNGKQYRL